MFASLPTKCPFPSHVFAKFSGAHVNAQSNWVNWVCAEAESRYDGVARRHWQTSFPGAWESSIVNEIERLSSRNPQGSARGAELDKPERVIGHPLENPEASCWMHLDTAGQFLRDHKRCRHHFANFHLEQLPNPRILRSYGSGRQDRFLQSAAERYGRVSCLVLLVGGVASSLRTRTTANASQIFGGKQVSISRQIWYEIPLRYEVTVQKV